MTKEAGKQQLTPRNFPFGVPANGFSLVELMIALALSVFLIGGVTLTFVAARVTAAEAETLSRVQENVRFASDYLIRDLRNAGFRDQLTLTFNQFRDIGEAYAEILNSNSEIIVRYAGRGTCGQGFTEDELKIIENRYFVSSGDLRCAGVSIDDQNNSVPSIPPAVTLASGVERVRFEFLDATGTGDSTISVCDFNTDATLATACLGVRVQMTFSGQSERTVEFVSAFRNVILDRVYGRD